MTAKAFVLIETEVGKLRDVAGRLRGLSAVENADIVTGPHDIIATVGATDLNAVGGMVSREIHTIRGVARTVTCLSVERAGPG
jgi:DNA-binding Lrp family transcriptional regulator